MKNRLFITIGILVMFFVNPNFAQNKTQKCKVVSKDMVGDYSGNCNKGLANGKGQFVFGDGQFMYVGSFKDGELHGKGEMFMLTGNKKKSIKKGHWEHNVYVEDNQPYVVGRQENLDKYLIKKVGEGRQIRLNFYQNGVRNSVTNLNINTSSGNRIFDNFIAGFDNVEFPFKCEVYYTTTNKFKSITYNVIFDFVINEPGVWDVILTN